MADYHRDPAVEKLRQEEFRSKPAEYFDALPKGGLQFGRRDFLKWSSGALALASSACVRKPTEHLVPYVQEPPEIIPGNANFYASTCRECPSGCGILVKTREGRPIKIEGNPLHPMNRGTVCVRGQASLFDLYDPDRLRTPVALQRAHSLDGLVGEHKQPTYDQHIVTNLFHEGGEYRLKDHPILRKTQALTWDVASRRAGAMLGAAGNRGVLLTGTLHGPARMQLLADFLSVYPLRHVMYDALNPDALVGAQQAAYGTAVVPRYFFDRAEMLVSFGGDPLGMGVSHQEYSVGFGIAHKVRGDKMSRLVVFEPCMSLTGLNADTRYLVPGSQLATVALALAHQLVLINGQGPYKGDAAVTRTLTPFAPTAVENSVGLKPGTLAALAEELWQNRGKSLVTATGLGGATADAQTLELTAAFLNSVLGNEGVTVDGTGSPSLQAQGQDAAMLDLCAQMRAGKVQTLLVYGTNPVYTLPTSADVLEAFAAVPNIIVIADRLDETAQLSDLVLPSLHGQESWGDAEPQQGLYSLVQPTIEPLFDGRSFEDALIQIAYLTPAGAAKFKALAPSPAPVPPPAPTAPTPAAGAAATPAPAGTATTASAMAGAPSAVGGASTTTAAGAAAATAGTAAKAATAAKAGAAGAKTAAAAPATPASAAPSGPISFHDYLREYWRTQIWAKNNMPASFDDFWTGALQAGVFDPNPARLKPGPARTFRSAALTAPGAPPAAAAGGDTLELALNYTPIVGDGAVNNNALLLEIPDPISKICWDNAVWIAPSTGKRLGWQDGDLIKLTVDGATLTAPLHVQPGVHPGVAALAIGWGRRSVGEVGTDIGVNGYALAQLSGKLIAYGGMRVQLAKVGDGYLLASPQGNSYLEFDDPVVTEVGRQDNVIRDTTLVQIQTNPRAGNPEQEPPLNLWRNDTEPSHTYPGHHWGMTVDLNACIGCNACVAACYAENNVSVVGKDQVWRGREMAWIRIDRYFSGEQYDNPDISLQPMMCQQCENAGCESVCPVIATITDYEGLNVQIYNRCVGTRFCSNNCIYKVRRFNFYQYSDVRATPLELALNPEVTVRTKGIMEKCTFCVQRIHDGHYRSKALGVPIRDGDITPACAQTCPTRAIVFGDMNDPDSKMMQLRGDRGYRVLQEKNFQPSVTYLTKVRNRPDDAMPIAGVPTGGPA